ncbi:DUF241 domain protein [Medicago truncatula]|nr:DUF241 domain protein [Medicago truncatula]
MATLSPKKSCRYGIRSISLPTRSHPSTIKIQEELNKFKSYEAMSSSSSSSKVETICFGLYVLVNVYKCMEDVLKLAMTQQALFSHKNEKWVDELVECPVRFLDILGETRDVIMLMKGNFQELQSALRRRKFEEYVIESYVSSYWSLRRSMKKSCTKSLFLLKQIDESFGGCFPLDVNQHISSIVRVFREVSLITSSIFQSLVEFLASPIFKTKVNKWKFVSRVLMRKGGFDCNYQEENINELEKVDLALCRLMVIDNTDMDFDEVEKIQCVHKEVEAIVVVIEGFENGLDCLFKHLINTRVSFLNILSP